MAEGIHSGAGRDVMRPAPADHTQRMADATMARDKEAANQRDENLRLECLKLAVGKVSIGETEAFAQIVAGARTFYEFTQGQAPSTPNANAPFPPPPGA